LDNAIVLCRNKCQRLEMAMEDTDSDGVTRHVFGLPGEGLIPDKYVLGVYPIDSGLKFRRLRL
jgi:hypothetical protein